MKKYRAYMKAFVCIEIDAENAEDAEQKAYAAPLSEWEITELSVDCVPTVEDAEA